MKQGNATKPLSVYGGVGVIADEGLGYDYRKGERCENILEKGNIERGEKNDLEQRV